MTITDALDLPMRVVRGCFGKQRFDRKADATKALMNHLRRGKPTSLNVYRCKTRSGFHIGNKH
jgi:hypothetical protein